MPRQTPSASDYTSVVKSSAVANDVASKPAGSTGAARAARAAVRGGGGLASLGTIGSIVKHSGVARSIAPPPTSTLSITTTLNDTAIYTYSWTQQTNAPAQRYGIFVVDDNGTTAITSTFFTVSPGPGPFITTNRGASWSGKSSGMVFPGGSAATRICLARSNSSVMYAFADSGGYLYKSTNGGDSWTQLTSAGARDWRSISCDSLGSNVVASAWNNRLYKSTDGGSSWTILTNSPQSTNWRQTFISDGGNVIAGVIYGTNVFVSTDGGSTFTSNSSFGNYFWNGLSGSSDGSVLFAGHLQGAALSKDFGQTWTDVTPSIGGGVASCLNTATSINGNKLVVARTGGSIYASQDRGITWIQQTSAGTGNWEGIGINATGTTIMAGTSDSIKPWVAIGS